MDSVEGSVEGLTGALGVFLLQHWVYAFVGVSAIVGFVFYHSHKISVDFWRMNAWYGIPFIGKLDKLAGDKNVRMRSGWLHNEETLCADYGKFIRFVDPSVFEQRQLYLHKVGDLGREKLPAWLLALLVVLVVAEGYGFSYLLAGSLAQDMSENARQIGTLAIAVVLCILLVFITHQAGHHLYRNLLLRRCRAEWDEHQRPGPFRSVTVKLTDDQRIDDDAPEYTQCMNRLEPHQNWWIVGVAAVFIILMAVLQVWMRVSAADLARVADTAPSAVTLTVPDFQNLQLPDVLTQPQQAADSKASADAATANKSENYAAFIMLSIIFVVTQAVGTYSGFKYGFAGKQSVQAYRETRGAADYHEYISLIDGWIAIAEARLSSLHQKIQTNVLQHGIVLDKTFKDFLKQRPSDAWYASEPKQDAASMKKDDVVALKPNASPKSAAPPTDKPHGFDEALKTALGFSNKTERDNFLSELPEEIYRSVVEQLKVRARRKEELDGLA